MPQRKKETPEKNQSPSSALASSMQFLRVSSANSKKESPEERTPSQATNKRTRAQTPESSTPGSVDSIPNTPRQRRPLGIATTPPNTPLAPRNKDNDPNYIPGNGARKKLRF